MDSSSGSWRRCSDPCRDIITFKDFTPLKGLLRNWRKSVLFVAGNHEYYTGRPMREHDQQLRAWLKTELPQVHFLRNEHISLSGVNFFGDTMWTDFRSGDANAMRYAAIRIAGEAMNVRTLLTRMATWWSYPDAAQNALRG